MRLARVSFLVGFVAAGLVAPDASADPRPLRLVRYAPEARPNRACSFRLPICVSGPDPARVLVRLRLLEDEWNVWAMRGQGTPSLLEVSVDPPDDSAYIQRRYGWSRFDRAVPVIAWPTVDESACKRMRRARVVIGEAWAAETNPSIDPVYRRGLVESLLPEECGNEWNVLATKHPEAPTQGAWSFEPHTQANGITAFHRWFDQRYGRGDARMAVSLFSLTATKTPAGDDRWVSKPNPFEILKTSVKNFHFEGASYEDVFIDHAVEKALVPNATMDWEIDWPLVPRRILSSRSLYPGGASYVWIHGPPKGSLRIESEWEDEARIRWVFVKLDASGKEFGRVLVPTPERTTSVQMSLTTLSGTKDVLLVGVNIGDPRQPLDPKDAPWEPHAWLLSLAQE